MLASVPAFNLRGDNKDLELSINEGDYLLKFGRIVLGCRWRLQTALTWAVNADVEGFYYPCFWIYAVHAQLNTSCLWQLCSHCSIIKFRECSAMRELWFHKQLDACMHTQPGIFNVLRPLHSLLANLDLCVICIFYVITYKIIMFYPLLRPYIYIRCYCKCFTLNNSVVFILIPNP